MFRFLKPRPDKSGDLNFADVNGLPLHEGDLVESLRYDLGRCRIIRTDTGLAYESLATHQVVSWARMIDAASKNQKVKKIG